MFVGVYGKYDDEREAHAHAVWVIVVPYAVLMGLAIYMVADTKRKHNSNWIDYLEKGHLNS